ncbi:MAG: UDP-N-acetylglucosamine 2-epimerase [Candidatus Moranbacteria bacterium GW2011_GWD2_37_9]|uniref:UDP-N-acetylglucosamine 2-epimerase n=1 Tax=Candidatus Nomurabacteria bacterium GW2011_GWE1_35_16 TaxID=1618761 RepID=A0A0G0B9D4_9BACT|nr:MAG: UDP-N-acetylglucosamine 2-epimerase [Candidatus Nomurabacteria bacterium GW2011_GWE1_35_16]KKQ47578.1 MAG: UDP-N-acetylglucosamine 2-epimerase [Candidatus Moranbacteria bacterium GW2011_GWD2_37_9]
MKVVSLIGARPQYIKEAVLNKAFREAGIEEIIVNSGQHYDYNMADVFFEKLGIKAPDYNLKVGSGLHGEMTAKIMIEFEKLLMDIKPDMVLLYGDTNTTLAGAIVAAKLKIKFAHVEAGIRMLPKDMPEEINRTLTDRIANLLFCPSQLAVKNLEKEGITEGVYFTGDVMYDLFLESKNHFDYSLYESMKLDDGKYILVTLHRDYNVDDRERFGKILEALSTLAQDTRVVFSMHPRSMKMVKEFGYEKLLEKIDVLEPIDYLSLMGLLQHCKSVVTDSGGLQKESYFSKKPGFLLMPDPAWHELVELKMNHLCKPENLLEKMKICEEYNYVPNIYGDGKAGKKIVKILESM